MNYMNEFDKSFISKLKINDLTKEEINNLRIQRNEIDKILNSYEANKPDIQKAKNELCVGKYFKERYGNYITYYKILSANPFYYLNFTLCEINSIPNIIHLMNLNISCLKMIFFNIENDAEFYFDNLIEITEEEFNAAMDRKYQEFKQELSNTSNIKELIKIKDKRGVGVTHAVGCEFRAKSKEEYDRIIEESRKAMVEYYEKENSKKEKK